MGVAVCHSGSSRVPSSLGGCSIAVACAFRFDCSVLGTCPESGDEKTRHRTIRNRVAGTGLAHDSIVSPLNAWPPHAVLVLSKPRTDRQGDDGTWMRRVQ